MKRIFFVFAFLFSLALPVQAAETVTVNNVGKQDVYNFVLTAGLQAGYTLQSSGDYNIVFRQSVENDIGFTLNWGAHSFLLHNFTIAPTGSDVMVSYEIQIVAVDKYGNQNPRVASWESVPGYFPAYREDVEKCALLTTQSLRMVKAQFNGLYMYGMKFDSEKKRNSIEITEISKDSVAGGVGLKKGDLIVFIDSQPIKKISHSMFTAIIAKYNTIGAPLTFGIKRDNSNLTFTITPNFLTSNELKLL